MLGVFDELVKSFAIILLKSKVEESRDNYSRDSKLPVRRPSIRNKHVEKCKHADVHNSFFTEYNIDFCKKNCRSWNMIFHTLCTPLCCQTVSSSEKAFGRSGSLIRFTYFQQFNFSLSWIFRSFLFPCSLTEVSQYSRYSWFDEVLMFYFLFKIHCNHFWCS